MTNENTIDSVIRDLFDGIEFREQPSGLYDPLRYMIGIGGKRIRPSLCLLAYSLYAGKPGEDILEPAAALEVFHSFTLIHDDIMDRSPLRRGMPTVWKKWNEDTAILSGDVMLIDAYRRMAKAPKAVLDEVMDLFSTTAAQVCEGQQYDMEFEEREDVTMTEYEEMIGLKTAVLIACAAKMGALVAGAPKDECQALYNYGYQLGMAFQVADDYLDAFGDEKVFGKPIGGDILNEKKSWLTLRSVEKATDKEAFFKAFGAAAVTDEEKRDKIRAVRDIYVSLGVDKDAKAEVRRFSDLAMKALEDTELNADKTGLLREFAEKLVGRAK